MPLHKLTTSALPTTNATDNHALLSPSNYDDDAASVHSSPRSEQDTDSEDDELQSRARNSRELLARDRLVLMEEDELEDLVTDTRKRNERTRRGSALALPNPLSILGRRGSGSGSRSPSPAASLSRAASGENGTTREKPSDSRRHERRARRQRKRERLMEDAQHGEDGELMFEMEEGGFKDGSSTGDSSDRDDSTENDRMHLRSTAQGRRKKGHRWRRWLLIHLIILVGFAILVLGAWKMSKKPKGRGFVQHFQSNGTALFAPTTIIISLDGFRADFVHRGLSPRLSEFIKQGVSPKYMLPSFPSVTFPNHYTLATGLYPESHGIVSNSFYDPALDDDFYYTHPDQSLHPKWWKGEPFWVTAERQGIRSAVHMWPGSEAHIQHMDPSFVDKYNGKEKLDVKASMVLDFLDKPGKEDADINVESMRPQVIAAYVPNVDADGHKYGPNSTEVNSTIAKVDGFLDAIFTGLEERNLTSIVNIMIVSDHGMASTDVSRLIQLEDLTDVSKIDRIDGWPLYGIRPKNPDDLQPLYDGLADKAKTNPNIEVYLRDENMPERYHFSHNDRIAPLWIVPKTGWAIVTKDEFDVDKGSKEGKVYHPKGLHGYDHEHPLMRAIFVARGPAFPHPAHSEIKPFQNTEVYNMLCDSVGIDPMPNNGTLRLPLKPVGLHDPDGKPGEVEDPVPVSPAPTAGGNGVPDRPTLPPEPTRAKETTSGSSTSVGGTTTIDVSEPSGATASQEAQPSGQPAGDGDEEGKEDDSSWWGWLSGTFDKVWNKVKGTWEKVKSKVGNEKGSSS